MAETDSSDLDKRNYEELRTAIRDFDRVIRSQMQIQGQMSNRIKNSIRAGMLFLVLLGISIFILLASMVTQVKHVSGAVNNMASSFDEVKLQMAHVDELMQRMERNVSPMVTIGEVMQDMDDDMILMSQQVDAMQSEVGVMSNRLGHIRQQADLMNHTAAAMDMEIYRLNNDMHRMAKPARSLNNMIPFPW